MRDQTGEVDETVNLDDALDTAVRRTRQAQEVVDSRIDEEEAPKARDAETVVHRAADLEELAAEAADKSVR